MALVGMASLPAGAMPHDFGDPQTAGSPTSVDEEAVNRADFNDYKRRLFRLIIEYRRNHTTVADIENIFGQSIRDREERYNQFGWIVGASHTFKSLRMNHRISLYYDPARGRATIKDIHFEVQYYVNFSQAEPPMKFYSDGERCLSALELERALSDAGLDFKIEIERPPKSDQLFISAGSDDLLNPGGIFLLAAADLKGGVSDEGSPRDPDLARTCIQSVLIS